MRLDESRRNIALYKVPSAGWFGDDGIAQTDISIVESHNPVVRGQAGNESRVPVGQLAT